MIGSYAYFRTMLFCFIFVDIVAKFYNTANEKKMFYSF